MELALSDESDEGLHFISFSSSSFSFQLVYFHHLFSPTIYHVISHSIVDFQICSAFQASAPTCF